MIPGRISRSAGRLHDAADADCGRRISSRAVDSIRTLLLHTDISDGRSGLTARPRQAIAHLEEAMRLSPHDPQTFLFNTNLSIAHYVAGRYAEAVTFGRKAVQQRPGFTPGIRIFAASLAQAGKTDELKAALGQLKSFQPEISIAWVEENIPYKPRAMAKLVAGLRKAGLQ